jgi:hypothetical protein
MNLKELYRYRNSKKERAKVLQIFNRSTNYAFALKLACKPEPFLKHSGFA